MDKQIILNEINKTKEHLASLEERLKQCNNERWKPESGERFYYLNSFNVAVPNTCEADFTNAAYYNIYNCFPTREQAE